MAFWSAPLHDPEHELNACEAALEMLDRVDRLNREREQTAKESNTMFIPIHIGALALVLAIMTVMGVTNHMGWEIFPHFMWRGHLGGWLITASHHQRHHEQYGCNYGLYFRFWDRLCGTDRGLGDFDRAHALAARRASAAGRPAPDQRRAGQPSGHRD